MNCCECKLFVKCSDCKKLETICNTTQEQLYTQYPDLKPNYPCPCCEFKIGFHANPHPSKEESYHLSIKTLYRYEYDHNDEIYVNILEAANALYRKQNIKDIIPKKILVYDLFESKNKFILYKKLYYTVLGNKLFRHHFNDETKLFMIFEINVLL